MSNILTRRALLSLAGATASTAALGTTIVPAVYAATPDLPVEDIAGKVERLALELSAALGEYYGGQFRAIVGPDDDVIFQNVCCGPGRGREMAETKGAQA